MRAARIARAARAAAGCGVLGALALTAVAAPAAHAHGPAPGASAAAPRAADRPADAATAAAEAAAEAADAAAAMAGARAAAARAAAEGVAWEACDPAERLPEPVECGTVTVPVDYRRPHEGTIPLRVSRLAAAGPAAERQGALLYNPGGPGGDGLSFPLLPRRSTAGVWQELHRAYDLVGYSPRGVGRSAPLSCQDPDEFWSGPRPAPARPSEAFKRLMNGRAAAYAVGCHRARGAALAHFTTADNARDLHVLRAALGEDGLTFLGTSYGSYLGSVYATLFPGSVRRMVLDSVVDPDPELIWYGSNLRQSLAFESRWQDWKEWVARHHAAYGLGTDADAVQRAFDRARERADREGLGTTVGAKEVHDAFVPVVYSDDAWPRLAAALAAFERGSQEELRAAAHRDPRQARRRENATAVYTAVECNDAPWPREWARWDRDHSALAARAPFETWENAWLNLPCAHWPVPSATPVDVGTAPGELPPVLLVHATRDAATPYRGALETRRRLAGSSLVTEVGAGRHGVTGGNGCVDAHVAGYLLTGATPGPLAECPARPAPEPGEPSAPAEG